MSLKQSKRPHLGRNYKCKTWWGQGEAGQNSTGLVQADQNFRKREGAYSFKEEAKAR